MPISEVTTNRPLPCLWWLGILFLTGWVVIIPPIRAAEEGFYLGADGRPAAVSVGDPLFQWTVYGRYQSGAACEKARAELEERSLNLNPASATAVAWSFAKCLSDNNPLLTPQHGPNEMLIPSH